MEKTTRARQKEETRAKLLSTAYDLYAKNGIISTRMSDIADAAEVSHGTVFSHFASQENLISEVIELTCGLMARRTHDLSKHCADIRELLSAHLCGLTEYEDFYKRLILELPFLPQNARSNLVSIQSAISLHLSSAFESGIAQGTIIDAPIHLLFNTWLGLIEHYLIHEPLFAPEGHVLTRYKETLLDHYMLLISIKKS